jgi:Fe-Mn family superoxide dismutase|tara:strand:- start:13317 stop:13901 length:585 start_codon:yes stop_codon:yes gene_type:complete
MTYKEQKFNLPELKGISSKQVEVHLGLYGGYVKHVNLLKDELAKLQEQHPYTSSELRRRFSFEFNGMRMHEYYFEQLENGATPADQDGAFAKSAGEKYGSWEKFIQHVKDVGMSRGIGWTVVYFDQKVGTHHIIWVGDHELGQLGGLPIILAMDMWEHAYMVDYTPAEKGRYIDAFLANLNWGVIEKRFTNANR